MKYLLDTDVVSQYTKLLPNPRVGAWIQRTDDSDLYISFVACAELRHGVDLIPNYAEQEKECG